MRRRRPADRGDYGRSWASELKGKWEGLSRYEKNWATAGAGLGAAAGLFLLAFAMASGPDDYLDDGSVNLAGLSAAFPADSEFIRPQTPAQNEDHSDFLNLVKGGEENRVFEEPPDEEDEEPEEELPEAAGGAGAQNQTTVASVGPLRSLLSQQQNSGANGLPSYFAPPRPSLYKTDGETAGSIFPSYGVTSEQTKQFARSNKNLSTRRLAGAGKTGQSTALGSRKTARFGLDALDSAKAAQARQGGITAGPDVASAQGWPDLLNVPNPAAHSDSTINVPPGTPPAPPPPTPPPAPPGPGPGGGWQGGLRLCYRPTGSSDDGRRHIRIWDNCRQDNDRVHFSATKMNQYPLGIIPLTNTPQQVSFQVSRLDDPATLKIEPADITETGTTDAGKTRTIAIDFTNNGQYRVFACSGLIDNFLADDGLWRSVGGALPEPFMPSIVPESKSCNVFLKCGLGPPGTGGHLVQLQPGHVPLISRNPSCGDGADDFAFAREPECQASTANQNCNQAHPGQCSLPNTWGCSAQGRCVCQNPAPGVPQFRRLQSG
ncbi:MAG: hypothetical protein HY401_03210 [Elusimicrobia bacterium]|nr:hypothetical protein [Elusimicrobiota bacterium]